MLSLIPFEVSIDAPTCSGRPFGNFCPHAIDDETEDDDFEEDENDMDDDS